MDSNRKAGFSLNGNIVNDFNSNKVNINNKLQNLFILDSAPDSVLVNFTFFGDKSVFSYDIKSLVIENGHLGDTKVFPFDDKVVYSVITRKFEKQSVSVSKLKSFLLNLKEFLDQNNLTNVVFNELNLFNLNYSKVIELIDRIFEKSKYNVNITTANVPLNNSNVQKLKIIGCFLRDGDHPSPFINIKANDIPSIGLIDTGADVSLITSSFCHLNNLSEFIIKLDTNIKGIDNQLDIEGMINLSVYISNHCVNMNFFVIKNGNLGAQFLLGKDFLFKAGIVVDFLNRTISCNDTNIPWVESNAEYLSEIATHKVKLNKSLTLMPFTGRSIKFKLPQSISNPNKTFFIISEINKNLLKKKLTFPQYQCNALFSCLNNEVDISIHNNSNNDVELSPETWILNIKLIKSLPAVSNINNRSKVNLIHEINEPKSCHFNDQIVNEIIQNLTEKEDISEFRQILLNNSKVFAKDESDVGLVNDYSHRIDLKNDIPIACKPFRTPHSKTEIIDQEIDRMLKCGIIKHSKSAFAAPCLLVFKKNGKPRLVIDYRKLNSNVIPISYPLPHLETSLQSLGGNRYFSTLDLISGYHQIPLRCEDTHKTAFTTGRGLYEFLRLPFGLITSGSAMQFTMQRILSGLNNKICMVYIDDIVVFGKDIHEHDKNLNLVLNRLLEHGFKLNVKKCVFRKTSVECLGHIVSQYGIKPNPSKVECLLSKPAPKSVKSLKSFLGLCSYYRRFVPNFSKIAQPLNNLLKKSVKWNWSSKCQNAFDELISKLTSSPILAYPDYSKPFIVTTDASTDSIGAVLSQDIDGFEKPIAFYSRSINNCEKKYPIFDLEGLAIKCALQKWRYYLLGYKVIVRTDNQPIMYLLRSKDCQGRIGKYLTTIMEYNPTFQYLPGKSNIVADYLSRNVCRVQNVQNKFPQIFDISVLKQAQKDDIVIQELIKNGTNRYGTITAVNDLYYLDTGKCKKLLLPDVLLEQYINYCHSEIGCHEGIYRTYKRMIKHFFFANLKFHIRKFINKCVTCIKGKPSHQSKNILGLFPVPDKSFQRWHLDLCGPFPKAKHGYKFIFVAIDAFSHYCVLAPLIKKNSDRICNIFRKEIIDKFGHPTSIVTDCGAEFKSQSFISLCNSFNIENIFTSPYHHASNGLVERLNLQVENALRTCLLDKGLSWHSHLNNIQTSLNSTIHTAIGMTPYEVVYGNVKSLELPGVLCNNVNNNLNNVVNKVRSNLIKTQTKMEKNFNKFKRNRKLSINSQVFVKIQNNQNKLKPIYDGPYTVVEICKSGVSYMLRSEKNGVVYKTHINLIK